MVINFICRSSKAGKDGLSPIELSIIINGQRKYITTDRRVKASSFNTKTQKVAKDKATNEYLEALRAKVYAQETEMIKNSIEVTMETFIDIYKNGFTSNAITILQLFKLHNDQFVTLVEKNLCAATTLDKYNVTKSYLESFIKEQLNKEDVLVKDITPKMVEDFFIYLLESMSNNTAVQKMKQLKKVLKMAVEEGYIKVSPFKMTLKKEDVEVDPLTLPELRKIRSKKITIERLARVRDMFVFECYTGLAFTDMANLTQDNFVTDANGAEWIIKSRQKTKIKSTIPLLAPAKEVYLKYQGKLSTLSNQKYNSYLKELADICGIEKNLHSHLARHTFATTLLNNGVDMVSVSKVLGHANSRITEKVYAKMLPDTILSKVHNVASKII